MAIPLPQNRFAFAKVFKSADFGIYDLVSDKIEPLEAIVKRPFAFFQASTDKAVKSGEWLVIGAEPFSSEEEGWAPPRATCYVRETQEWTMGGIPRIHHKGKMQSASIEEVKGLDILSVCPTPQGTVHIIVDRLIRGNNDRYKVP